MPFSSWESHFVMFYPYNQVNNVLKYVCYVLYYY